MQSTGAVLEELAFRFQMLGPIRGQLVTAALALVGFVAALLIHRKAGWSIRRVPSLLLSTGCYVLGSTLSFAWLLTYQAMAGSLLWLLTLSVFLGTVVIGYVSGTLAHARSVNAFGVGKHAWIAAVPIFSLILVFSAPQQKVTTSRTGPVGDGVVIAVTLLLFLAIPMLGWLRDSAIRDMANKAAN